MNRAGSSTATPGGQTTPGTEAGSLSTSPGGQNAHPHIAPLSFASPTFATPPCGTDDSACMAPASATPPMPLVALSSPHYSCHPCAVREPPVPPLLQQSPPAKAVLVAPLVNPHPMTRRAKRGFWLPTDKLTLSATSSSPFSPVPTSVHAALTDPSRRRAMEEEMQL
jgi:hypothetical protein